MATALVDDFDHLLQELQVSQTDLLDLRPTSTEELARTLAGFAPVLAGLAMLF